MLITNSPKTLHERPSLPPILIPPLRFKPPILALSFAFFLEFILLYMSLFLVFFFLLLVATKSYTLLLRKNPLFLI